jgi:dihydroorotase-like cyclic amidohydrolase
MLFAEQSRGQSLLEAVDNYSSLVSSQGSYADYGFHAIITDPSETVLQEELPVLARQGIMSMKLFLTYKHMRISDNQFLRALLKARELGMVALVHAENGDLVDFFTEQLEARGLTDPMYKTIAHPNAAEAEATNRAVTFANVIETPLLIVHVSDMPTVSAARKVEVEPRAFLWRQVHMLATSEKRREGRRGDLDGLDQWHVHYLFIRSLPLQVSGGHWVLCNGALTDQTAGSMIPQANSLG